ncbi:BSP-domain-containing protein [Aspergillus heteromorphus CBS 117.55]|uniref:BSP-domain-containing protein n=1 Tax=Aspergillus heteromorphus CBS 117.55 TaxID=1448321 RepID=A0A317VZY1_9EURO|nr:BSP-domain-containing protein [Aspergillus heteromorphus CBS 117.55]PWY77450.1 BSP-domain-containing protein [Aspergillus heteromorphus CBS 117.55]
MSTSSATQTPLPVSNQPSKPEEPSSQQYNLNLRPNPKLRLQIHDLRHSGSKSFSTLIPDVSSVLETALAPAPPTRTFSPSIPPTRSVTVLLRDIDGVAYTTGTELDNDHKEIHVALSYVRHCTTLTDPASEIKGFLTHELVHCYQHTAPPDGDNIPRPPGGLIEGIADFVRLKADLAPPHWKKPTSAKERASNWDQGYQHTAYFLAWLEDVRVGEGAVGLLNDRLLRVGYVGVGGEEFWKGLFGVGVLELWEEYGRYLDAPKGGNVGRGNWEDEIVNPE